MAPWHSDPHHHCALSFPRSVKEKSISSCMMIVDVFVHSIKQGIDDDIPRLSAALAFYALLSLVPLLMFLLSIISIIFGDSAREHIHDLVTHFVGSQEGEAIQTLLTSKVQRPERGAVTTLISFFILLYGSSNVFNEWHQTLNFIWKVSSKPVNALTEAIYQRLFAAVLVLVVGMIMIASVILNAVLTAIGHLTSDLLPGVMKMTWIWGMIINLGILTLFFAASYKIIPDEKIIWKDVWIGASLTAVFFSLGQFIIGFYIAHTNFISSYGASGSLIALLIWIYYSAQISFLGAEFTHTYAHRCGSHKTM